MYVQTARSLIALPARVRRELQAEEERRVYAKRLAGFAALISLPFGFLTGLLVWASSATHSILGGIACGIMISMMLAGGLVGYHRLIFRGMRIPA